MNPETQQIIQSAAAPQRIDRVSENENNIYFEFYFSCLDESKPDRDKLSNKKLDM